MGGEYDHSSFLCIMKRKNKKVKFKLKNYKEHVDHLTLTEQKIMILKTRTQIILGSYSQ